jgi:gamma-glutamyl:cysteine ligase YbdK (ATP-grasp superfamily)
MRDDGMVYWDVRPSANLAPHALRAAYWKSARDGLDDEAIDLTESHASVPALDLLIRLIDHVRPALEALGEHDMVRTELARIVEDGNGAMRQRRDGSAGTMSLTCWPRPQRRAWSERQVSGSSAKMGLVGITDPPPGSTVKARVLELPRSGSTAVVDGATDFASMVPADCGPLSPTNHIW